MDTEIVDVYNKFNSQITLYSDKNDYLNKSNRETMDDIRDNIEKNQCNQNSLIQILTPEKLLKECLTFDLLNYIPKEDELNKINNVDDTLKFCLQLLKKYQYRVGGFCLEDEEWIIADKSSHRFKINENQKVIYNSIHKKNYDRELVWFLDSIFNHLKRYVNNNIVYTKYNIYEDEKNSIFWVVYKFDLLKK